MPFTEILNEHTLKLHFNSTKVEKSALLISDLVQHLGHYSQDILDIIPAYTSLTIILDFNKTTPQIFEQNLAGLLENLNTRSKNTALKNHVLPCYYGEEFAWDLTEIATRCEMSTQHVIEAHSQQSYRVYALGFSPGFPYLGFVDKTISTPRKRKPRKYVPAGAVGIAENQTGIYPNDSPGGWNIIACCPITLFDTSLKNEPLSTLNVGDKVSFRPISKEEFIHLGGTLPKQKEAIQNQ